MLSAAILGSPIACANAQTVAPGQLFPGELLNVRAPASAGWRVVSASESGMAFFRAGVAANESYVAHVSLFALPESKDATEFVALIKHGFESDTSAERFKSLKAHYAFSDQRGYPCVTVTAVTEDTQARTSSPTLETLKLQLHSLYCRHPKQRGTGFVVGVSHRGTFLDGSLDAQAKAFIEGVQVSGN